MTSPLTLPPSPAPASPEDTLAVAARASMAFKRGPHPFLAYLDTGSPHTPHMTTHLCPPPFCTLLSPTLNTPFQWLLGLPQHSSQVLPPTLHISTLNPVNDLSSSSWHTALTKSWNGDFLVLTPAQTDGAGTTSAVGAAAATHSFARLAALLRCGVFHGYATDTAVCTVNKRLDLGCVYIALGIQVYSFSK